MSMWRVHYVKPDVYRIATGPAGAEQFAMIPDCGPWWYASPHAAQRHADRLNLVDELRDAYSSTLPEPYCDLMRRAADAITDLLDRQ